MLKLLPPSDSPGGRRTATGPMPAPGCTNSYTTGPGKAAIFLEKSVTARRTFPADLALNTGIECEVARDERTRTPAHGPFSARPWNTGRRKNGQPFSTRPARGTLPGASGLRRCFGRIRRRGISSKASRLPRGVSPRPRNRSWNALARYRSLQAHGARGSASSSLDLR